MVPLQYPRLAAGELGRLTAAGLMGAEIGTRAGGLELGAEAVDPFFEAAADRNVPVLVHALEGEGIGRLDEPVTRFGVGVPFDETLAATSLYLAGTLGRHPRLRICICHGGGDFFWNLYRLRTIMRNSPDRAATIGPAAGPGLFVDTAGLGPANLRFLSELSPAPRIMLGSDFPATAGQNPRLAVRAATPALPEDDLHRNARAFLGSAAASGGDVLDYRVAPHLRPDSAGEPS
jgi:aminocarboxymuconate-semialdehyde decarboxylase